MGDKINIAIDGPAGAGKSTIAKLVAEKLNYIYIDTGAMYRALTFYVLEQNVNIHDGDHIGAMIDTCSIKLNYEKDRLQVFVNENNVTKEIRTENVTKNVSTIASYKKVRQKMLVMQQEMAKTGGTVMDGRDIGTHVLPNAEVKIFLTASADERAKRRHEENLANGFDSNFDHIKSEIVKRDEMDSTRTEAPLRKADDAIEIDSTFLSIEEVVQKILKLVDERTM